MVLYGGERAFAAGADIKEMADRTPAEIAVLGGPLNDAVTAVARLPQPVIAAVTGYALGGGWNWRWPPTSGSWPRTRCSGCRRSPSASSPEPAARSGCRG